MTAGVTTSRLRAWLEAHHGAAVCDSCVAQPHAEHGCGIEVNLDPVLAKRFDKAIYDLRHKEGLEITTERAVCPRHGRRSHYRLTGAAGITRQRLALTKSNRAAVRDAYDSRDAYSTARTERGHVDHRIPHVRTAGVEPAVDFSDPDAIRHRYLWITEDHNRLKNSLCKTCVATDLRPPFLGVHWWFAGGAKWDEEIGCWGCGWAYPEEWRQDLQSALGSSERDRRGPGQQS